MSTSVQRCKGFDGNADLYGLGIRIGVYLQWVSSWLSVSFEPSSAQETHNASSIFVFAIVIAIIQASYERTIRPIEAYIMTQICWGYLFTVLSISGMRLQLLGGARLGRWVESIKGFRTPTVESEFHPADKAANEGTISLSGRILHVAQALLGLLNTEIFSVPMRAIGFLKQDALSWSGVLWRSLIVGMVASCNIWLWFVGLRQLPSLQSPASCTPVVFIFSKIELHQAVISFLRMISIIYGVIVYYLLLTLILVALKLINFGLFCIQDRLLSDTPSFIKKIWEMLLMLLRPGSDNTPVSVSDLLKALVFLSSGDTTKRKNVTSGPHRPLYSYLSGLWHLWLVLAMAWFILSIELTLRWNNIEGVDTIRSTGQLIPFIIGIASTCNALKRIILALIKNKHPEWEAIDLHLKISSRGIVSFEIVGYEGEGGASRIGLTTAVATVPANGGAVESSGTGTGA